ncbi:glycosyltransferase [Burkholderia stagnalis]|uniref:glycosyltransferase n=1 Tax=Burkholderia stagnalis TaxID=1503054 RepID=UPI000F5796E8|nr:nucleotide disphospho-sugar-binding domain-containing protein [Burkholderia stagnalis]
MTFATRPLRVLCFGEAATFAHVARPYCLAKALDKRAFEVHFACDARYAYVHDDPAVRYHEIHSKSAQAFLDAIETGAALYSKRELIGYTEEDLALIRHVEPDVVVGDFRHSLSVATRLAGVPYVALINAYWSTGVDDPVLPVPEIRGLNMSRLPFVPRLMPLMGRIVLAFQARALDGARRHFGLPPFASCRAGWTFGDRVGYYDSPSLVPLAALPAGHAYLGPVSWSPAVGLPDWWTSLDEGRPVVYVSLGSSGDVSLTDRIVDGLLGAGLQVVTTSGGRYLPAPREGLYTASFLPGAEIARRADLVISNGGSPTGYQALGEGTPVIGIPTNMDQLLAMRYIERYGAGLTVRPVRVRRGELPAIVARMLADPAYAARAREVAGAFAQMDPFTAFPALLREAVEAHGANSAQAAGAAVPRAAMPAAATAH